MGSYSAMYPVVSCPVSSVVITQPLTTTTIRSNTLEALVHNPPKETAIRLEPKVLHNCQHIKHTCRKVRILRYEMFYIRPCASCYDVVNVIAISGKTIIHGYQRR